MTVTLDQFYTAPAIAKQCLTELRSTIRFCDYSWLEPSAGAGAFYGLLPNGSIGVDLDPKFPGVLQHDFLTFKIPATTKQLGTIGNPPFGKRSRLAVKFFNKAALSSKVIAFVVPLQFRKWSVQKQLDTRFRLVSDTLLPEEAFICNNKPYRVRCCFQIWVCNTAKRGVNLRILSAPAIAHPDFEMWQYNYTKEAEKFFHKPFTFAIPRQGFSDYSRRETNQKNCERTTQWMLVKANSKKAEKILRNIDYAKLAKSNTTTPGFGKADLVKEYERCLT